MLVSWKHGTDALSDVSNEIDSLDRHLGDYRLIREIGRGGMGIVYEAEQISLERRVALKILPMAALLDDRQLRRFKNEARAAAALQHPNIVSVYGVGYERSVNFYAMELIDGPNLATVISTIHHKHDAAEAIPAAETLPVAALSTERNSDAPAFYRSVARSGIQAANALHAAHEEGIIHRDVKPANMLLDRYGAIHVTDFGLARFPGSEDLTFTGDRLGTLRYMSPEQIEADRNIDRRSDVYSLGVTLYELLAGQPAFSEQSPQKLARAIVEREPVSLSRIDARIPLDLATIVSKAISKEASERYSTAQALADDLDRFVQGRTINARPAGCWSQVQRFARRNPSVTSLLAISSILFAFLAVGSAIVAMRFSQINKQKIRTNEAQAIELIRKEEAAYAREMLLTQSLIEDGNFGQAEQLLLNWVPAANRPDLRGIEWAEFWRLSHPDWLVRSIRQRFASSDIAFSPDGERLVQANFGQGASVWSGAGLGSGPIAFLKTDNVGSYRAQNIDGTDLFVVGNMMAGIQFRDWQTLEKIGPQTKLQPVDRGQVRVNSIDADPSNQLLAIGTEQMSTLGPVNLGRLSLREIVGTTILFDNEYAGPVAARFLDPRRVVFGIHGDSHLNIMDINSLEVVRRVPLEGNLGRQIHVDQSRHRAAFTLRQDESGDAGSWLEVRDTQDWSVLFRCATGSNEIKYSSISPSGRFAAAGDVEGNVWLADTESNRVTRRKLHHLAVNSLTFSPDESLLATTSADTNAQLADVKKFLESDHYRLHSSSISVGPNRFCSAVDNQTVSFWNLEDGPTRSVDWRLRQPNGTYFQLAYNQRRNLVIAAGANWPKADLNHGFFVAFYDLTSESQVGTTLALPHEMPSRSMPISPDGRYVVISRGHDLFVIDLDDFSLACKAKSKNWISASAFTPDGKTIVVATGSRICFLAFDDLLNRDRGVRFDAIRQHPAPITDASRGGGWDFADLQFIPETSEFAVVCDDLKIKIFDSSTGRQVDESGVFPDRISFLSVSPDGKRFGLTSMGGYFRILTYPGFDEVAKYKTGSAFTNVHFSLDGNLIIMPEGARSPLLGDPSGKFLSLSREQLMRQSKLLHSREPSFHFPPLKTVAAELQSMLPERSSTDWARIVLRLVDTDGNGEASIQEFEESIEDGRRTWDKGYE